MSNSGTEVLRSLDLPLQDVQLQGISDLSKIYVCRSGKLSPACPVGSPRGQPGEGLEQVKLSGNLSADILAGYDQEK